MKKWAVGSEQPEIPDFRSVDRLTREHGLRYLEAARRFWFVPEDMRFRAGGGALLFDSGEMTVKTEYIQQTGRRARAEPADEVFARAFSERYGEIAAKYPVFEELFEYAKFVSLARHIKDNGVPLLWFLLANRDLALTETSPGTVDALIKESEYLRYVTIEGGVDLARHTAQESYVIDAAAVEALVAARRGAENSDRQTGSSVTAPTVTFVSQDRDYSVRSSNDVVVGAPAQPGTPAIKQTWHCAPAASRPWSSFGTTIRPVLRAILVPVGTLWCLSGSSRRARRRFRS